MPGATENLEARVSTYITWLDLIQEGEGDDAQTRGDDLDDTNEDSFANRMQLVYRELQDSHDPLAQELANYLTTRGYMNPNNSTYKFRLRTAWWIIKETLEPAIRQLRNELRGLEGGRRKRRKTRRGKRTYRHSTRRRQG
jgi:hypothetical protein